LQATAILWWDVKRKVDDEHQTQFNSHVDDIVSHIRADLVAHEIVLNGLVGLFNASPSVTRDGFRQYYEAIRPGSGIFDSSSFAYHENILAGQVALHVNKLRQEGVPDDYRIKPDGSRDSYAPLIYIEPFTDQNRKALGFDPYTVEIERIAIERARDSGQVTISSKLVLEQDSGTSRPGFVMYAPIYRQGQTYFSQDERRKMFVGWVDSPLRMESFVLNLHPEKLQGINLEIFDTEVMTEASRIYPVGDVPHIDDKYSSQFRSVRQLEYGQHTWTLVATSLPEYSLIWRSDKPTWIAAIGILLSLLISLSIVWGIQAHRRFMKQQLLERTKAAHAARDEERNLAQRKLLESERDLSCSQRIARVGSYVTHLKTGTWRSSPILDDIFGIDDTFNRTIENWLKLMAPGYEQEMLDYYHVAVKNRVRVDKDYQIVRPVDGRVRWVSALGEFESGDDGDPSFLRGTIQDITERKLAEIALNESEARLQATLNAIPDEFFELGSDGIIYSYHAPSVKQLAIPPQKFLGRYVADSYPANESAIIMAALQEANQTGYSFGKQIALTMSQGKRHFEISIARKAARSGEETRFIALSRDITKRKIAEERTTELSQRLVLVQENTRKRLSGELHDRTSPNLAAIKINLNMIASTIHYMDQKNDSQDTRILVNCFEHIEALIEDTAGSVREICSDLRPPVLDYGGLIPALENYVEQFQRRTNLQVGFTCLSSSSIRLPSVLESALFRISQEALTNCAKHSRANFVQIALDMNNQAVVLSVCDNGIGFAPRAQEDVFATYGLGIITMEEMVEFLDGKLELVSAPGAGTQITVRFPLSGGTA